MEPGKIVDARKDVKKLDEALGLARRAARLVVCKGKKVTRLDMKKSRPSDEELAELMLGPTGNLRAPLLELGEVLVIGFNDEVYRELLG